MSKATVSASLPPSGERTDEATGICIMSAGVVTLRKRLENLTHPCGFFLPTCGIKYRTKNRTHQEKRGNRKGNFVTLSKI